MKADIREMQIGDLPAVTEIDRMSFSLPWPESSFRHEIIGNKASRCLVAVAEERRVAAMIVGWLVVDELHIATFATHPDFRRQGIGAMLLRAALQDARERGARRAFLEVRVSNVAAHEMYAKFGFEVSGRRPEYYRDNKEDALLMTLKDLSSL